MLVDETPTREEDDGRTIEGQRSVSSTFFLTLASALVHYQHQQPVSEPLAPSKAGELQAHRLCGRWLVVRRLSCDVSATSIAERTGVDASTLQMIEQGLVKRGTVSDRQLEQISYLLADVNDADLVMGILKVACNEANATSYLIERILADLHNRADMGDTSLE
jgi:transcriptional regulator with XRE-family HTH domain